MISVNLECLDKEEEEEEEEEQGRLCASKEVQSWTPV